MKNKELEPTPEEMLLTINEWLDVIGCDRAYRKDMKKTYKKTIPELKAQVAKALHLLSQTDEPPVLNDKEIRYKLEEIQPEGFDWVTITETEMIKFKAIAQAQVNVCKVWSAAREQEAYNKGFDEGVVRTTDACDSTFSAELKAAVKKAKQEERERIILWIDGHHREYLTWATGGFPKLDTERMWQALKDTP